jgi:hypothetical protein
MTTDQLLWRGEWSLLNSLHNQGLGNEAHHGQLACISKSLMSASVWR